jgi:branched-chain amino acid transport system ATP-binding protein
MRLAVAGLRAGYGRSEVLFGVDLHVDAGESVALIGRNGAGKTTTLQCVIGVHAERSGSVRVDGTETIALSPHRIARLGVALVPQGRRIFPRLTVEENLRAGWGVGRPRASGERAPSWTLERLFDVFPQLAGVRRSKGAWLSGGEQQLLAIARALVADPHLLLLVEPTEGLAPRLVETLTEQLLEIRRAGLTILLAEQHLGLVTDLASRAYVIDRGQVRAEGKPAELLGDERIRHAYLSL